MEDGKFKNQGNLHMRLVLGYHKMGRSLHLVGRIFKVYANALPGFSHTYYQDDLKNTLLSQVCVLGAASNLGKANGMHIPRIGEGMRSLQLPGSSSSVILFMISAKSFPLN